MTLTLITVFSISWIAELTPFNGHKTTEIMNRLPMHFIPANYVSFIWIFIYLLLAGWLYHFSRSLQQLTKTMINFRTFLFILSAILNLLWVLLLHYELFSWTAIVMIGLLATLTLLYFSYDKHDNGLLTRMPISIYFSWVILSFFTMLNYILTLNEWNGWGLSNSLWTVIFLTIATAIALHFMYHYQDIAFNIVFMWVFIGIAVYNGFDSLFVSTAALFLTAVIAASYFIFKKMTQKNRLPSYD